VKKFKPHVVLTVNGRDIPARLEKMTEKPATTAGEVALLAMEFEARFTVPPSISLHKVFSLLDSDMREHELLNEIVAAYAGVVAAILRWVHDAP
jgi:hypothetical protein